MSPYDCCNIGALSTLFHYFELIRLACPDKMLRVIEFFISYLSSRIPYWYSKFVKHTVSDSTESCLTSVVVTKARFIIYISPLSLKRKIDDSEENNWCNNNIFQLYKRHYNLRSIQCKWIFISSIALYCIIYSFVLELSNILLDIECWFHCESFLKISNVAVLFALKTTETVSIAQFSPKSEQVCWKEIFAVLTSAIISPLFGKDTSGLPLMHVGM